MFYTLSVFKHQIKYLDLIKKANYGTKISSSD